MSSTARARTHQKARQKLRKHLRSIGVPDHVIDRRVEQRRLRDDDDLAIPSTFPAVAE